MSGNIRKTMQDVTVQHNEVVRRPSTVPDVYTPPLPKNDSGDRIEKNPFFAKPHKEGNSTLRPQKGGGRGILWAFLFVVVLSLVFYVSNYFATATIEVVPTAKSSVIDSDLEALKGENTDALGFDITTLSEEKAKEVTATIEKKIQKKASGKVIIYNAYNADSQRLIKNTRLESPDHKIFRIDQSVVVPGAKVVDGKSVPGSVEALIYADAAGKEYNIGTSNFTIPGFKGDPRYAKFSAASKPDSPIGGGFTGLVKVPSDEAIAQAQEELKNDLKKVVVEKARADIPEKRSFFPGSMVVKFEEVPQEFTADDTAKVSMRATVSVFFFDTARLTAKIADISLSEDKTNPFVISNMSALTFAFIDPVENVVLTDLSQIKFHLSGTAEFVGQIDTAKIQADLAGKSKKDFSTIIDNEKNIGVGTKASVWPVWKTEFPVSPAKITVNVITKEQK